MTKLATSGIRALIAEDEPLVSTVIENELDMIEVNVVGRAADGREAVSLTGALNPDVVLMDIEMPEMNGIDAARHIQDWHPTPVVMLTVYSAQMTINQAAAAGAGAYVIKPPRASDLERAILIARARFHDLMELRRLNADLKHALAHVKRLQGLLPICMFCHKIRTDRTSWEQLEMYISEHTDATFTHGICPTCLKHHFPELQNGSDSPQNTNNRI
jgi:two-component system, response regulator PdtaR